MIFNVKKHSDLTVTISGEGSGVNDAVYFLHAFPLVSKSHYFDQNVPDKHTTVGPIEMIIKDFPGGPAAFEIVARYCYGMDVELTVDNIAHVYCACRVLQVPDLEKSTEAFMTEVVLRDPSKAATVLKVATGIANMTDSMMEGLVGHSINAIASMFTPIPELNLLPPDCFSCIVRTARDMDANKRTLEAAVASYLDSHISEDAGVRLTLEEWMDVVASPGRQDDMRHAETVYNFLEVMLRHYKTDAEAEQLCKGLHELGFWVCLPHVVIERAYSDRNIPDRYCTVALMAENRHLIKANEQLAEQVESLTEALRAETAARAAVAAGTGSSAWHSNPTPPAMGGAVY